MDTWQLSCTSVTTGRSYAAFTFSRIWYSKVERLDTEETKGLILFCQTFRPCSRPGPRKDFDDVRFALSKLDLNTRGTPSLPWREKKTGLVSPKSKQKYGDWLFTWLWWLWCVWPSSWHVPLIQSHWAQLTRRMVEQPGTRIRGVSSRIYDVFSCDHAASIIHSYDDKPRTWYEPRKAILLSSKRQKHSTQKEISL